MDSLPPYGLLVYSAKVVMWCLEKVGEPQTALVGGMAVNLHGLRRETKDLDIIILNPSKNEADIKNALVRRFPQRFSLKPSEKRMAKYKKLFYHVPERIRPWYGGSREINVDILLSTVRKVEVHYRGLGRNGFEVINGLRVAPIHFVLFHKLLGWDGRRDHKYRSYRVRAATRDKPDIIRICELAYELGIQPLSEDNMGGYYQKKFIDRASKFVERFPWTAWKFRRIGFEL